MDSPSETLLKTVVEIGGSRGAEDGAGECMRRLAEEHLHAQETADALEMIHKSDPELVILRLRRPEDRSSGLEQITRASAARAPVVVVDERPDVDTAVRFIKAGAYDYIGGSLDNERLDRLISGIRAERLTTRGKRSRFFAPQCPAGVSLAGRSEGMVQVLEMLRLVAESRCNPILILGETGVGKELAAQVVHAWRCGDPERFVTVNCAALTASLLESELFGHVKGAFTGAEKDKTGLFELANSGSLLLDEISEMTPDLQAKLLRVLQERKFRKVGGTRDIECNATVIATSNRQLSKEAESGRFRKDLYYRLAVFPVEVPPLRSAERRDDISLLAEYFLETLPRPTGVARPRLTDGAHRNLLEYHWPGNVRELRNVLERGLILERSGQITASNLILGTSRGSESVTSAADRNEFSLETAEREFILRALRETGWQRTRAAALLGITRATLHAKLKRYGLQPPKTSSQR